MNAALSDRTADAHDGAKPEHRLETSLCRSPDARRGFEMIAGAIDGFRRQLPVGLFDGTVTKGSAWTPGGKSQGDLWARSSDGKVLHVFELKAAKSIPLGIVPEALYYARILHHVRTGLDDGRTIIG